MTNLFGKTILKVMKTKSEFYNYWPKTSDANLTYCLHQGITISELDNFILSGNFGNDFLCFEKVIRKYFLKVS